VPQQKGRGIQSEGAGLMPVKLERTLMADRVPARIRVGGTLAADCLDQLAHLVAAYDLRCDWDSEPFDPTALPPDGPLDLYALETRNGSFDDLEAFCVDHGLAFWRWAGGTPGSFTPEIVVFTGRGAPESFQASEGEIIALDPDIITELENYEAIVEMIERSRFEPPAFCLTRPTTLVTPCSS
jgi:hypothetical protein